MEINEFTPRHIEAIRRFVNSDEFLEIKDAFVAHTPEGGSDGNRNDDPMKNFGKLLGTRYVFNQLQKLARTKPEPSGSSKKQTSRGSTGADPDMEP